MHETDVNWALAISMDSVLEQMFFVTELAETDPAAAPAAPRLKARVGFAGDPSGWIDVEVEETAAAAMAADFLAADAPDLSPGQIEDVVLELSNMLCGAALSRMATGSRMRLSAPQVVTGAAGGGAPAAVRSVFVGTGTVTARLHFEPRAGRPDGLPLPDDQSTPTTPAGEMPCPA
jgi:CheY-specific phosphatase CheX